jgi:hypothetical protein
VLDVRLMHVLIGALVGAVFAVGLTVVMGLVTGRRPTWKSIGLAALGGAVSGGIASATLGAGGLAGAPMGRQLVGFGLGGAVGGGTERAAENVVEHRPVTKGVATATVIGGASGLVSLGVTRTGSSLLARVRPTSVPTTSIRARLLPASLLGKDTLRRIVEAPTPGTGSGALQYWRRWRDHLRERERFEREAEEPAPTPGLVGALAY